ncbi:hypothetical protein Lal_00034303 [Lupinus albus]|uniref:Uncharacterized protein n=1 Tax=Lupinus albus TaxID=3870 RepID=A0A6A4QVM8_LUPAL|nr:putative protein LIN37 [Lupinus albus]KAF1896604.1 hypothetical protein Lal_00034303 [Lupinus albus]
MAVDPKYGTTSSRSVSPLPQPQPQPQPLIYPLSSSGIGFIPKPSLGAGHVDYHHLNHHFPSHLPPHPHPKAALGSAVSDRNGYKDASTRERSRDDSCYVIRDRKVRITEDASLYALCRSWLRNGVNEEKQPQQKDVMKALPRPLPAPIGASMSNNEEDDKQDNEHEEDDESVENLSPQDLLKKHVQHARKVRARLREQRVQRIKRYRSRLTLLLPQPAEQFRNDMELKQT